MIVLEGFSFSYLKVINAIFILTFYICIQQFGFRWRTENEVVSGKGTAYYNILILTLTLLCVFAAKCMFFHQHIRKTYCFINSICQLFWVKGNMKDLSFILTLASSRICNTYFNRSFCTLMTKLCV